MANSKRRLWYDITMALTFPSVLGTVIYSLLDTGMHESFIKGLVALGILNPQDIVSSVSEQPSLLIALGLTPNMGLIVYLLITLFVAVQYSCDYLYSKYFEPDYTFEHFLYDLVISAALGVSFVGFSAGVRGNLALLHTSFEVLWIGFIVSYLTYLLWDYRAWKAKAQNKAKAQDKKAAFFRGMVAFEIVCLVCNTGLFALTKRLPGSPMIASLYIPVCLTVMAILSFWFFRKVWRLEALSR